MSKEKLTNQLKKAYKSLEEEFKNKGRPNTIEDNNVDYDNCNLYAMRQKISDLEAKLAEKDKEIMKLASTVDFLESEKENLFRTLEEANEDYQDKISFAVERLEKVKAELVNKVSPVNLSYTEYVQKVFDKIDNQIKQLKETT